MKRTAAAALAVLALAGCSGSSDTPAAPAAGGNAQAGDKGGADLAIGQTFKSSHGTFAVLQYKPDINVPDGPRVALELKACADQPGLTYGENSWALLQSDGTQVQSTWLNSTPPEYSPPVAVMEDIPVGECKTGWLFFEKKDGATTARLKDGDEVGKWDLTRTM